MFKDFVYAKWYEQYMKVLGSGMLLVDIDSIPLSIKKKYSKRELRYMQEKHGLLPLIVMAIVAIYTSKIQNVGIKNRYLNVLRSNKGVSWKKTV